MEVAAEIAEKFGASLDALSVIEPSACYAGTVGEVDEERAAAEIHFRGVVDHGLTRGA
jgi:hypothetical protein